MCVGEGRRWSVQGTCRLQGGESAVISIFGLLGVSSEGVSGAGDTPSGVTSFRDSAKEDKGESGGYLWVVMGVLRFVVRGVSTTRGDTGTREAPPWVTVLWDSVTGFMGKGVQLTMNYWEGLRICFQRLYGTGRLPVKRISLGLFSSFVGRRNSIGEEFGGRAEG